MINKLILCFLFSSIFISSSAQINVGQKANPFSGTLVISLQGGFTIGKTDFKTDELGLSGTGMLEYFFYTSTNHIFGLRFFGGGQNIRGSDEWQHLKVFKTDMYLIGGGLVYSYSINNEFYPYLSAGISNLWFNPKNANGKRAPNNSLNLYEKVTHTYDIEFGTRFPISDVFSFHVGFGLHLAANDNLDDTTAGTSNDFFAVGKLGFSISLFGKKDSDGDDIYDKDDPCPSSTEDFDGFEDDDGCPDLDNDRDGILDTDDKCPNEAEDFNGVLDDDGCPDEITTVDTDTLDNDFDRIINKNDNCPDQPETFNGFEDSDGCPDSSAALPDTLDNDKDGIADTIDNCLDEAETFNGFKDEDGCPDTLITGEFSVDTKEITLSADYIFDLHKSEIKRESFEELNRIVSFFREDPFIKWVIEGHTSGEENEEANKSLSTKRAQSILDYFISKELPSFQFRITGKGSSEPVTNDTTDAGRIKNNRIEMKKIE